MFVERCTWNELTDEKQFSRLLYTSPVCLLGTWDSARNENTNVMTISWLTATNNEGCFAFSINKRRHSASILKNSREFSLSVPVAGHEELVRNVGGVSGSWGSKFPADRRADAGLDATEQCDADGNVTILSDNQLASGEKPNASRKRKKKGPRFPQGIPGLELVSLQDTGGAFAIAGTVAHLHCKVYNQIMEGAIDDQHYLVLAKVISARVHPDYWDDQKKLFRPVRAEVPPYLTFFGSQQFGYTAIAPNSSKSDEETATKKLPSKGNE